MRSRSCEIWLGLVRVGLQPWRGAGSEVAPRALAWRASTGYTATAGARVSEWKTRSLALAMGQGLFTQIRAMASRAVCATDTRQREKGGSAQRVRIIAERAMERFSTAREDGERMAMPVASSSQDGGQRPSLSIGSPEVEISPDLISPGMTSDRRESTARIPDAGPLSLSLSLSLVWLLLAQYSEGCR